MTGKAATAPAANQRTDPANFSLVRFFYHSKSRACRLRHRLQVESLPLTLQLELSKMRSRILKLELALMRQESDGPEPLMATEPARADEGMPSDQDIVRHE